MSKVERSTPLECIDDLYIIYETRDPTEIPFLSKLKSTQATIREIFTLDKYKSQGIVLSIEGTWGSGKTTLMNLTLNELTNENAVIINYDSLFYGNVSEATNIFINDIFDRVKEVFGIDLHNRDIAQNISPKFELSNGLPKINIGFEPISRKPTELIKDELSKKLKKIHGKVIIIIDDLDRVSADDVVHFLRIVRVLRELPNFIVILPIDKKALEDLLKGEKIANPHKYLEKIIDWSISVDPEINTAKTLFFKKVKNNAEIEINADSIEELWRMVLLQLAIHVLDTEEIRSIGANIGTGKSDQNARQYERKAGSQAAGNASLMRAFMERTSTQYGATYNLVTKMINDLNPTKRYFRSYISLYGGQNFTDFLQGYASPGLSMPDHLEDPNQNLMKTQWWRDSDYIASFNGGTIDQNYEIPFSDNADQAEQINTQLNDTAITLWSELRNIVEPFYPYEGLTHLSPRSINKIVAALNIEALKDILARPVNNSDVQMEMYIQVRYAISDALKESST